MKYEYLVILEERSPGTGLHPQLEKLGLDGWELVSVAGNPGYPTLYLKRQITTVSVPEEIKRRFMAAAHKADAGTVARTEGESVIIKTYNTEPVADTGSKARRAKP